MLLDKWLIIDQLFAFDFPRINHIMFVLLSSANMSSPAAQLTRVQMFLHRIWSGASSNGDEKRVPTTIENRMLFWQSVLHVYNYMDMGT